MNIEPVEVCIISLRTIAFCIDKSWYVEGLEVHNTYVLVYVYYR